MLQEEEEVEEEEPGEVVEELKRQVKTNMVRLDVDPVKVSDCEKTKNQNNTCKTGTLEHFRLHVCVQI